MIICPTPTYTDYKYYLLVSVYNKQLIKTQNNKKKKMISSVYHQGQFFQLKNQHAGKKYNESPPMFKSVESSLEVVLRCQKDLSKRPLIQNVIAEFFRQNDPAVCTSLDLQSLEMFTTTRDWLRFFKFAFIQLTNEVREYSKFENSNTMDYLILIQPQIDYHNIVQSYKNQLLNLRFQLGWTEQFVEEWVIQAVYMKQNNIELFKKREEPRTKSIPKRSLKRSAPSSTKAEQETQTGEAPMKRIKKDSVNFRALVLVIERILEITTGDKKQNLQQRLNEFKQRESLQYLQLLDQQTAKRIFQMRSYIKLFLDAIKEATAKTEFKKFEDKNLLETIFSLQGQIDPDNVFQSYKSILEQSQEQRGWPRDMIDGIMKRVVEFKKIQTQYLLKR